MYGIGTYGTTGYGQIYDRALIYVIISDTINVSESIGSVSTSINVSRGHCRYRKGQSK